jgi:hypothetical protein
MRISPRSETVTVLERRSKTIATMHIGRITEFISQYVWAFSVRFVVEDRKVTFDYIDS